MMKENIILADCLEKEVHSFAKEVSYADHPFQVKVHIANWKRSGKLSELKRYAMYFWVAVRYFLARGRYNAIIGWQQFYALIFCFYCSLFHVEKRNIVVVLNYTYKEKHGIFAKPYRWFMKKCMDTRYLDILHVLSESYADIVSQEFAFPRERIIVTTFGINDMHGILSGLEAPEGYQKDGYALAIGRSNRDYDFLIRAWKNIDYPLVIISDTYKGSVAGNNRILHLDNVAGEDSHPWIANCSLMIVPIADGSICSGDTVLLTAMSLEKKILVSSPSTLAEMYIVDGQNAVLYEKNEIALQSAVRDVLYGAQYRELGERARESFLKDYSRQSMGEKVSTAIKKYETRI